MCDTATFIRMWSLWGFFTHLDLCMAFDQELPKSERFSHSLCNGGVSEMGAQTSSKLRLKEKQEVRGG